MVLPHRLAMQQRHRLRLLTPVFCSTECDKAENGMLISGESPTLYSVLSFVTMNVLPTTLRRPP